MLHKLGFALAFSVTIASFACANDSRGATLIEAADDPDLISTIEEIDETLADQQLTQFANGPCGSPLSLQNSSAQGRRIFLREQAVIIVQVVATITNVQQLDDALAADLMEGGCVREVSSFGIDEPVILTVEEISRSSLSWAWITDVEISGHRTHKAAIVKIYPDTQTLSYIDLASDRPISNELIDRLLEMA